VSCYTCSLVSNAPRAFLWNPEQTPHGMPNLVVERRVSSACWPHFGPASGQADEVTKELVLIGATRRGTGRRVGLG